jgi:hypothetical protein
LKLIEAVKTVANPFNQSSRRSNYRRWVDDSLTCESAAREALWSEAIAVGNLNFVERAKSELGFKAAHLELIPARFQRDPVGIQHPKSKIQN